LLISLSFSSKGSTCHIASSLRLFVPNSLEAYGHFFFSEDFAYDVCDRLKLPTPRLVSHGDYSVTAPAVLSLRPLVPSSSLISYQAVQVYQHHPAFPRAVHLTSLLSFRMSRQLNNSQSLTFRSPIENPTVHSSISSSTVFLKDFPNFLCFFRRSCSLASRSFIRLLHSRFVRPYRGSSCNTVPAPVLADRVPWAVQEPSSGSDQLLLGPTIALGLFLRLSVTPLPGLESVIPTVSLRVTPLDSSECAATFTISPRADPFLSRQVLFPSH
jgi:hypothetical protein